MMGLLAFAPIGVLELLIVCLIGLPVLIGGLVLLVVLAKKAPKAFATVLVVGLMLLMFIGLPALLYLNQARRVVYPSEALVYKQPNTDTANAFSGVDTERIETQVGSAWLPEVEQQYDADVYASVESAGRALGKKIAPMLTHTIGGQPAPSIIRLSGVSQANQLDASAILHSAASVFREAFPEAKIMVEAAVPQDHIHQVDPQAVDVRLIESVWQTENVARGDHHTQQRSATLRLKVVGQSGETSTSVRLIHKPWVESFAAYSSSHPGQQHMLARSSSFADTAHQARQQAARDAAIHLAPMLQYQIQARSQHWIDLPAPQLTDVTQLEQAIMRGQFVVDSFTQRLSVHGGEVWREAILIDPNLNNGIHAMAQADGAVSVSRRSSLIGTIFSVAGLFLFIALMHWFLNAVTKGYYARPITITLTMAGIVGLLLLLLVA